jgi:hypothetical protein
MSDIETDGGAATIGTGATVPSSLMQILMADDIVPGAMPSYELAKELYVSHPLGAKMAEAPIEEAQSQEREIKIRADGVPEDDLVEAFQREWMAIGMTGADEIIKGLMTLKRVYGIASLGIGGQFLNGNDYPTNEPLPYERLHEMELYFNVWDPLNTAGSLVLNQNPNAPDFQKPQFLRVSGKDYHSSRAVIALNESPIYIEWTNSAFGFVGRSVYQRALFPLKTYIQTMITDQAVAEKAALLVAKMKSPGSVIDQRARQWFGLKRQAIKGARTGNVVSMGIDESLESIDLKNLRDAAEFSRNNCIKNIATAAKMPASMLYQETLTEGFGEGSEDAKIIARFIARMRIEMNPAYRFMDRIVMRRAWSPEFYKTLQRKYAEYQRIPYETAFYEWQNAFTATWPNLLVEPDSELVKVEDVITKAAISAVEVLGPMLDPENKAKAAMWLADVLNERKLMFSAPLELDEAAIASYVPPEPISEPHPTVESSHL